MISIVVAIDDKRGIGKNGELLFRIPEDFTHMRSLIFGHPLIMGRKTHESIGRVLPDKTNIIITRDKDYKVPGAIVVSSLEEALKVAKKSPGAEEIVIFGGGQIFKEAMEQGIVDVLHLTVVKGDYGADVFFPEYPEFTKELSRVDRNQDGYEYSFIDLARASARVSS